MSPPYTKVPQTQVAKLSVMKIVRVNNARIAAFIEAWGAALAEEIERNRVKPTKADKKERRRKERSALAKAGALRL